MINCPKCDSIRISGPNYVNQSGTESLRYRCETCGYSEDRPTADADKRRPEFWDFVKQIGR